MKRMVSVAVAVLVFFNHMAWASDDSALPTTWFGGRAGSGLAIRGGASPQGSPLSEHAGFTWNASAFLLLNNGGFATFGIQPEVQFVSETFGLELTQAGVAQSEQTTAFNSIRIPVLVKFSLGDPRVVQPSVYLGPHVNYVVGASSTIRQTFMGEAQEVKIDVRDSELNRFGYGLSVGADVRLFRNVIVDLRYCFNFSSYTAHIIGQPASERFEAKMGSVMIGLGVMFN